MPHRYSSYWNYKLNIKTGFIQYICKKCSWTEGLLHTRLGMKEFQQIAHPSNIISEGFFCKKVSSLLQMLNKLCFLCLKLLFKYLFG